MLLLVYEIIFSSAQLVPRYGYQRSIHVPVYIQVWTYATVTTSWKKRKREELRILRAFSTTHMTTLWRWHSAILHAGIIKITLSAYLQNGLVADK